MYSRKDSHLKLGHIKVLQVVDFFLFFIDKIKKLVKYFINTKILMFNILVLNIYIEILNINTKILNNCFLLKCIHVI